MIIMRHDKNLMNKNDYTDCVDQTLSCTETLWDFSLRHYGLVDIQKACLAIQDEYAGNVLLVLWNTWLDRQKCYIDTIYHKQLSDSVIQESNITLMPLRFARKNLKDSIVLNQAQKAEQKNRILSVELVIEKELLEYLHRCTIRYVRDFTISSGGICPTRATSYLQDYLLSIGAKQALHDVLVVPV